MLELRNDMRVPSSTCFWILGAVVTAAAATFACSSPPPGDAEGASAAATREAFDRNAVLDDVSLTDADAMTEEDVQEFLDETPWGTRSVLATYTENGKSAAQIIHATAQKHGINPLELLVRVQMEQGLVSKKTASASAIDIAFGCGCPHSSVCSDAYMGFANQAECAAGTLSRSIARAKTSTGTVSGWARNRTKETQDGMAVTPKNAATAALYTYTPWVGEAGGGKTGVGGASLHHAVWDRFATAVSYGAWATQTPEPSAPSSATTDAGADTGVSTTEDPAETEEETTADSGTTSAEADAGAPPETDAGSSDGLPPSDGSEDDALLEEGNAPPSSNAPPPKPTSSGRRGPEELPEATEEELAGKPKSQGGCTMASTTAEAGDGALFALGLAAVLVRSRRRARKA